MCLQESEPRAGGWFEGVMLGSCEGDVEEGMSLGVDFDCHISN